MNIGTLLRRIYDALYFHPETPSFWLGILMAVLLFLGRKKRHGTARTAAAGVGTLVGLGGLVMAAREVVRENIGNVRISDVAKLFGRAVVTDDEVVSLRKGMADALKHLPYLAGAIYILREQLQDARRAAA